MACSIETLLDLCTMSIEELSGRLSASDGRGGEAVAETGGKLLLTEEVWYLDSGASSRMPGCRGMFSMIDETVRGTVRFGDGSVVRIDGRGTVMFECLTGDQPQEQHHLPRAA